MVIVLPKDKPPTVLVSFHSKTEDVVVQVDGTPVVLTVGRSCVSQVPVHYKKYPPKIGLGLYLLRYEQQ